jgi:magnesium transporter
MRLMNWRRSEKAGLPPGSLVHLGEPSTRKPEITIFDYDESQLHEEEDASPEACRIFAATEATTWINVSGIHDTEVLRQVGECYKIHPLALEDILNTEQRPKVEDYEDYFFIVLKMLYPGSEGDGIKVEQVSIILGRNYVISFQEDGEDVFEGVRARLRDGKGRFRARGADYLAYALLDAIVDHYFAVLENVSERIEDLEDDLVRNPSAETLQLVQRLKRQLIFLRKSVWPLREVLAFLDRGDSPLIQSSTIIYLRDVYDHTIQVADTIDSFRDIVAAMHDTYLSSVSNRLNEVMKVLTIFATIFIPLTFLVGVFGMNFRYMPGLEWHWGYFTVWAIMIASTIVLLLYFRRKRWL